MYDIITLGAATYDVFLTTGAKSVVKSTKFAGGYGECFALGSKVEVSSMFFDTGGGATNAAVTLQHLGCKTAVMTKIGNDVFGHEVMRVLDEHRVNTSMMLIDSRYTTDYAAVLVTPGGERTVLVFRGASANINPVEVHWDALRATSWFYISSVGGNARLLKRLNAQAKTLGQHLAVNPGSRELSWGYKQLKSLLSEAEILVLNRQEAALLLGLPYGTPSASLISKLKDFGSVQVITDSDKGAMAQYEGKRFSAPALGKPVVNTTGAGDAFASAFTAGWMKERDATYALRLGILNSGLVVTQMGAKNGLLEALPSAKRLAKIPVRII